MATINTPAAGVSPYQSAANAMPAWSNGTNWYIG